MSNPVRVLVVDDSALMRKMIPQIIERDNGIQVVGTAMDGEFAIKKMDEGLIDAMVVQNPYEMGFQGARLLKALVKDDQATVQEMFPNHGKEDGDLYDTGIKVVAPDKDSPLARAARRPAGVRTLP